MSLLFLDTFSGISGDMMLGLLIDLGVEVETLQRHLKQLPIAGYRLEQRLEKRHGIAGTRLAVVCEGGQPRRSWAEIDSMLAESPLDAPVKTLARAIFRCLGEAEAHVHRLPPEEVHFHEVGAVDAIVDIVGSAVGLHTLQPERVVCAPLPLTRGLTTGEHGTIPLPAPATLHILHDQPVVWISGERELVTPTGAAIAATIAEFGDLPEMTIEQSGYGVGNWELPDRPNLLRGILGTATAPPATESDRVTILETHLDDASPEWLGPLLEDLLAAGALDAAFTPLQMKKNRPGVRLTVITEPARAQTLARTVLRQSSAIGIRLYEAQRMKLRRQTATISTPLGDAVVKLIYDGPELLRLTPEHDSCRKLAAASGRPLPEIYRIVTAAGHRCYRMEE